ncbi:MAG: alpha/beta fold hydrolase, partial [Candidatus Thermoplasmatota archaeon]|nr:alpha/beta fold hydrolase [Candidatus Thermoplasmatota archaeon]
MASADAERRPVLLVPGFSGQDLVYWNVFRRRLERDGYHAFALTLPGLALQDIATSARMLDRRIREVLDATGGDKLHLIGHSLGGLAMRTYLSEQNGSAPVGVCATLGTPHQGTLAALPALLRPAGRQMLPGSSFLQDLEAEP